MAHKFLELLPTRRAPDFGLGMTEGAHHGRHYRGGFVVRRHEDIQIVTRTEHGVAAQPLHFGAVASNNSDSLSFPC